MRPELSGVHRGNALGAVLLDAKLAVPAHRAGTVSRAALVGSARTRGKRVVGITAPAGYGKTTLMTEWLRLEDRAVAWVSLDRFDDDPARLLTVLASACVRLGLVDVAVEDEMRGTRASVLARAAPQLASALRSSPLPFVLMLDDLHEIRSSACHDALGVVIAGVPPGSQLVAASRDAQPHIPRLRALGDTVEIGPRDLALDAAGTRTVFASSDVDLSPQAAAAVTARTEGWPVGIYLASLIARDVGGDAVAITGDDRYVADYLQREAFGRLSADTRRFLLRTAVLEHLSAPLCDAVLDEPGADEQLRQLEATNVFLVPLDRRREWFRYHALFREFLLSELQRCEPDRVRKLQLRAADWYEAHASPGLAVEHLLSTDERDRAAILVATLANPTYQSGQIATVQRWIDELGTPAVEDYPPLALMAGYVAAFTGQTQQAQRWAAVVDAASFPHVPPDGSASFDSGRAMLRAMMCAHGPQQMEADAELALRLEPEWSVWRDNAQAMAGEAALLAGDVDRARSLFASAIESPTGNVNADTLVFAAAELALLEMDHGRWTEAEALLAPGLGVLETHRMQDYATCVLALAAAARLALHLGDVEEARRQLTRAMRARPVCTYVLPFIAVRTRLELARVCWGLGDQPAAQHLLHEIDDVLLRRPELGTLVDEVGALRGALASTAPSRAPGVSPLTPAELRLLPYLQTHLTIREIGDRLFVSRNTASSEIGSIYRKLGVSSRSEAVRRATAIGLLGA
ncbi:LuxR family transcriptional regulator [Cellulomonas humilata]|uniref:LuxR family transcriptional regulator n=1 Tax=Cellulomonas humilata TaxID=144055 RepID=A0A7Y6DYM7_9CELL|nr:LuxR family transcriptional regulator [Cellulomonas humilata]